MALTRALRRHLAAYLVAVAGLIALNWALGGYWWSLWAAAAWGAALVVHWFIHRASVTDEAWAEARAADLRSKSYDASHMDSIKERQGAGEPPPDKTK